MNYIFNIYLKIQHILMYIRMSDETPQEQKQCETGVVKWFNNKAGYGFITVGEGSDRTFAKRVWRSIWDLLWRNTSISC